MSVFSVILFCLPIFWFIEGSCSNGALIRRLNLIGACGPSRICGMRWRGQCKKPGLSSLPEIAMSYVPCVRSVGWSCFVSALRSITEWVHDTTNEISGRSTVVLDFFLLKRPVSENPFKGLHYKFFFLRKRDTSRNKNAFKPCMFAHNLLVCSNRIKVGVKWAAWGLFRFWQPTKLGK